MSTEAPADELGFNFRHFMRGLCDVVAHYIERDGNAAALIVTIITRLCRRQDRFMALLARFKAGTLRAPRDETTGRAQSDRAARPRAPDPVPRYPGYLVHMVKHEAVVYGRILEILLADPEMVALLAASPQAGRLLRPLWRMLHPRPLPAVLKPTPRPPGPPPPAPALARDLPPASPHPASGPPASPRNAACGFEDFGTPPLPA